MRHAAGQIVWHPTSGGWEVPYESDNIADHITKPFLLLQHNWFKMMEYSQSEMLNYYTTNNNIPVYKIAFQYATENQEDKAALSFHLTKREEKDIVSSIFSASNTKSFQHMLDLFNKRNNVDTVARKYIYPGFR